MNLPGPDELDGGVAPLWCSKVVMVAGGTGGGDCVSGIPKLEWPTER